MAPNDAFDQEMERRLREHFTEEASELRAPDDLWDRLEGQLGEQEPPRRFALLRGGALVGGTAWVPAAAAAVLVLAAGMGAWLLTGNGGGDAAPVAAGRRFAPENVEALRAAYAVATAAAQLAPVAAAPLIDPLAAPAATAAPRAAAAPTAAAQPRATAAPTAAAASAAAVVPRATAAPTATAAPVVAAAPAATAAPAAPPAPAAPVVAEPIATPASGSGGTGGDGAASESESAADGGSTVSAPPEPPATGPGSKHPPGLDHPPQPQQPAATTFEDYGRTPFAETSTDAISTFSLDTDRTSYFLALSWVRNGYTVEPDSVRAEEWINAFDYGYAAPGDDRSFAVTSEVARHPLESDRHLVRIALQAPELRDDTPLNVTLVLDASGSMSQGNRVAIAREAAETLRQSLSSRDRVAVVHFSQRVLDDYTVEHSAPDDQDVVSSISRLVPSGSTNVQAGLNLGVRLAGAARLERPGAYNYIILMSDGVANVDATDPFAILESAPDSDSTNPLRLITIGVGIENYNDFLLEQLAQHGNGWYRYLDDAAQARATFSRENWLALSTPFADQARAQVTWDPAIVQAWRIVGYENRITPDHTFEQNRREFAELPSGAATTVLYELVLHEGAGNRSTRLGNVEVRWVDPASGASRSQNADVLGDAGTSFAAGERYFRLAAIVGLAADRYSALSPQVENAEVDYAGIRGDLSALGAELSALQGVLGSLQSYADFRFLLNRLTQAAAELAPTSGYSR